MRFREIFEIDAKISEEILLFGISGKGAEVLNGFYSFMKERYASGIPNKESFLESEVPEDVMAAFQPVREMYIRRDC